MRNLCIHCGKPETSHSINYKRCPALHTRGLLWTSTFFEAEAPLAEPMLSGGEHPHRLECNGAANIILHLDVCQWQKIEPDKEMIREQAQLLCDYINLVNVELERKHMYVDLKWSDVVQLRLARLRKSEESANK